MGRKQTANEVEEGSEVSSTEAIIEKKY